MTNATGASAAAPSGGQGGQAPAAPAVDQVVARLSQLSQGQSALISLEPPELGRVLVRFVKRGKGWRVHLVADSREVAQALTRDLGRLSQVLGREADPIEVDVSTDAGQDGQRSAGSHDHDGEEAAFEQKLPPSPTAAARKSLARDARGRTAQQLTLSSLDVRG
jgi:flagellar hook-length control protein FliK